MTLPAPRSPMTAEELLDLPDGGGRCELVEGELAHLILAGGEHGALAARLGRLLDEYVEAHDLGVCCGADTGFILRRDPDRQGNDSRSPLHRETPISQVTSEKSTMRKREYFDTPNWFAPAGGSQLSLVHMEGTSRLGGTLRPGKRR